MTRKEKTTFPDPLSAAEFTIETILEIWGTNSTLEEKTVTLEVSTFDLDTSAQEVVSSKEVSLKANSATEIISEQLPGQPVRTKKSEVPRTLIVNARLLDGNIVLARYANW
jgi:beta-mannosidase